MEIATQEDHDMSIPRNTGYVNSGGGHAHHHDTNPSSTPLIVPSKGNGDLAKNHEQPHHHHVGYNIMMKEKHVVKYKECLKNHAASMGGYAIDGCGEFMPKGEEGSIEVLTCSVCNCHRNFHRREIECEEKTIFPPYNHDQQRKLMFQCHHKMINAPLPPQMIMPVGVATGGSNSESEDGGKSLTFGQPPGAYGGQNQNKRFRTKFSQEQKNKMLSFAERVGWKIQRQEESVVQQFCEEIGVRRRVLKVWMHNNNKHNLFKKTNNVDLYASNQ